MRVFFVDGAIQDESALGSYLIPNGTTKTSTAPCDTCVYDSYEEPYDFLVQGFDGFEDFDPRVAAFLPQTPPLVSSRKHIEHLADTLTGVVPVRVGFNSWEQSPVARGDWFRTGPELGALFVAAVSPLLFDDRGLPLQKCDQCGRQKIQWYLADDRIAEYTIKRSVWPNTDVFLLEGGGQHRGVCVTETAVEKLEHRGFTNLKLVEMGWA